MQCVAYLAAISGALKTFNIASLSFNKSGGNPESGHNYAGAGFKPDSEKLPDFGRSWIRSQIPVQP